MDSTDSAKEGAKPAEPRDPDTIILIHGTFAFQSEKQANANAPSWHRKSLAATALNDALAGRGVCYPEHAAQCFPWRRRSWLPWLRRYSGRIEFSWSGKNQDRDRWLAARRLYECLERLDKSGIHFHLVAHSYGGVVVWYALLLAHLDGNHLQNLKTWTTLGAPFAHYRLASPRPYRLLAVLALAASILLLCWPYARLPPRHLPFALSVISAGATFFVVFALLALACLLVPGVLRLGVAARRRNSDRRWSQAYKVFGSKHLAIASRDDEAILGLRASLKLFPGVPLTGVRVIDLTLRPAVEIILEKLFRMLAHGAGAIGLPLRCICTDPVGRADWPEDDKDLETELRQLAAASSAGIGKGDLTALLNEAQEAGSGSELFAIVLPSLQFGLIHCSYPGAKTVTKKIAQHVSAGVARACQVEMHDHETIATVPLRVQIATVLLAAALGGLAWWTATEDFSTRFLPILAARAGQTTSQEEREELLTFISDQGRTGYWALLDAFVAFRRSEAQVIAHKTADSPGEPAPQRAILEKLEASPCVVVPMVLAKLSDRSLADSEKRYWVQALPAANTTDDVLSVLSSLARIDNDDLRDIILERLKHALGDKPDPGSPRFQHIKAALETIRDRDPIRAPRASELLGRLTRSDGT